MANTKLKSTFEIWKPDLIGGLTTFLTMSYIVAVNPAILSTEGTGMAFSGVLTATVLLCFSMTLLMGLYAKLPFAVAPGMGLNAFFTFTLVLGQGIPWNVALGIVFWGGIIFLIISVTQLREWIANAIPHSLRIGLSAGIGIFLAFIGLKNAGLIVADPVTLVKMGRLAVEQLLVVLGFFLTIWLLHKKNPIAFLAGIFFITAVSAMFGMTKWPDNFLSSPDFESVLFKLDILGALQLALIPAIISITFTDLFDSISTFVGVSQATGLVDKNGEPKNLRKGLFVDAMATMSAGLFGTSAGTAYIESTAGIEAGGRTGRSAIVTAFLFLPCLFLAPIFAMIPIYATSPVLVLVGILMLRGIFNLELKRFEDVIPVFLTMMIIPLTFSITQGIFWGFISHTFLYVLVGKKKQITKAMWVITAISVGLLWMSQGM
jgi:AGZA family xanthine/uracil permease-like MFS transporter